MFSAGARDALPDALVGWALATTDSANQSHAPSTAKAID